MMNTSIVTLKPKKILIRSTNWVGDAIMTTPAVRTIRQNFPDAEITLLAYPWVADIFRASPHIDRLILYDKKGIHSGISGLLRLSGELREKSFDLAILLQNAFEAAFIALLAGIPVRAGYRRDARGLLLTHGIAIRRETRKQHQVYYYQGLMRDLGMSCGPDELFLQLPAEIKRWAKAFIASLGAPRVVGLNPGAAYGPAKRWPAENYAELAGRLHRETGATLLVFGTDADAETARIIKKVLPERVIDFSGKTSLAEAMALIDACDAFVTNDSGLMHVAAALKTPLVAIFGSTDTVATGPFSENAVVLKKNLPCSPCLKTHCHTDFECMRSITTDEVLAASLKILQVPREQRGDSPAGKDD
jgi:heptosyltransferase-2